MCWTIGPLLGAHRFGFLQKRQFWKAPTSGFHHNFILGHLVTPTQDLEAPNVLDYLPPSRGPPFVLASCKKGIFRKP